MSKSIRLGGSGGSVNYKSHSNRGARGKEGQVKAKWLTVRDFHHPKTPCTWRLNRSLQLLPPPHTVPHTHIRSYAHKHKSVPFLPSSSHMSQVPGYMPWPEGLSLEGLRSKSNRTYGTSTVQVRDSRQLPDGFAVSMSFWPLLFEETDTATEWVHCFLLSLQAKQLIYILVWASSILLFKECVQNYFLFKASPLR